MPKKIDRIFYDQPHKGINGYDWLAMPPGPYVFAVDSADEVPETPPRWSVCVRGIGRNMATILTKDPPEYGWVQLLGAS
jgi:hypothetical protein